MKREVELDLAACGMYLLAEDCRVAKRREDARYWLAEYIKTMAEAKSLHREKVKP